MANKTGAANGFAPVLSALVTMQSNVAGKDKTEAHEFLEKFQKSVRRIIKRAFGLAQADFHNSRKPGTLLTLFCKILCSHQSRGYSLP